MLEVTEKQWPDKRNYSSGHSVGHLGDHLAGLDLAVVQAQSEEFLEAGVDLLVQGGVLGADLA